MPLMFPAPLAKGRLKKIESIIHFKNIITAKFYSALWGLSA